MAVSWALSGQFREHMSSHSSLSVKWRHCGFSGAVSEEFDRGSWLLPARSAVVNYLVKDQES